MASVAKVLRGKNITPTAAVTHALLGDMSRLVYSRSNLPQTLDGLVLHLHRALFYRLNVFPIEIPPLRERAGDIPLLVHYFVSRLARRMQKKIETIPKHAMEALVNASWPGNVRELENFIERAVILTQGAELNVPVTELKNTTQAPRTASVSKFHDAERQAIIEALKAASGRVAGAGGAAERLGLKRTTLQNKMRQLQISRSDY